MGHGVVVGQRTPPIVGERRAPTVARPEEQVADGHHERAGAIERAMQAVLADIPPESVTARTAGALKGVGPFLTAEEERVAFETAVAEENSRPDAL